MDQAEHYQRPHHRQRHPARQREDACQQQQLEAADMAEILRPPFRNPVERMAGAERRERDQQRARPVGRQAARCDRQGRERQPAQQRARPFASLLVQQPLEHGRPNQPERQDHAAVQIGPQHQ